MKLCRKRKHLRSHTINSTDATSSIASPKLIKNTSNDSVTTFVEKTSIAPSVNNKSLRMALNRHFDISANKKLEKIFKTCQVKSISAHSKKTLLKHTKRVKKSMIIDEFIEIKDKRIWNRTFENFRSNPRGLINAIEPIQ